MWQNLKSRKKGGKKEVEAQRNKSPLGSDELRPKTPEGDVWVPVERVRPRQASSRLRGIEVGGPSAPAGCRILPSQIQAGLLGLTLLYKDTRGGDKTIISDYERTNSDTFSTQWELRAVKTARGSCAHKSQLFRQVDADLGGWGSVSHFREQLTEKIFALM